MLRASEKRGFFEILNKLSDEDVISLKDTVTQKQITTVGKIAAINAIITYTEKALELLRRKKVRKDVLFQYLMDCEVVVAVTAEKDQLINRILTYWETSNDCLEISASKGSTLSVRNPNLPDVTRSYDSDLSRHVEYRSRHVEYQSRHEEYQSQSIQHRSILHSSTLHIISSSQEISGRNATETAVASPPFQDKYILAKQFIEWFYKMLNSHNPSLQDIPNGEFGPQHFWQDCKLELHVQCSVQGETNVENFDGSMSVAQRFLALAKEERLLFNPNLTTDGIKVNSNPHGLLLVMTCGTLHRVNECLGIFEQVFGLINDPTLYNNWKVKMTQLKIKSSQHPTMPRLDSGDENTLAIYAAR